MNNIYYEKWNKYTSKLFLKSCDSLLHLKNSNFYNPIYSLYFYFHNTKKSRKKIDIKKRYTLTKIYETSSINEYTSNLFLQGNIHDNLTNTDNTSELFAKCIPILDPIHTIMNNYSIDSINILQPSNYIYNTLQKVNSLNNSCYIDGFFSFISSELYLKNKLPCFPIMYGSINGISNNFKYDITEEYSEFLEEKWFHKNIGKRFNIDMYISDSDSDDSVSVYNDDSICNINKMPVQYIFLEKLEGTLEDIENKTNDVIKSCLFQIIFGLSYLQKHFEFTHNDLHINNIMYSKTDKLYLYYKYNNLYFKVPTHGYIFKIIDFGRSIFTFKNRVFNNDSFSKYGEAEGQYNYPIPPVNSYKHNKYKVDIEPNYSFDMCRLASTLLSELDKEIEVYDFLLKIMIDKDDINMYENMTDDFDLYIQFAKKSCKGIPYELIHNELFTDYRIKKRMFPTIGVYRTDT